MLDKTIIRFFFFNGSVSQSQIQLIDLGFGTTQIHSHVLFPKLPPNFVFGFFGRPGISEVRCALQLPQFHQSLTARQTAQSTIYPMGHPPSLAVNLTKAKLKYPPSWWHSEGSYDLLMDINTHKHYFGLEDTWQQQNVGQQEAGGVCGYDFSLPKLLLTQEALLLWKWLNIMTKGIANYSFLALLVCADFLPFLNCLDVVPWVISCFCSCDSPPRSAGGGSE